VGDNLRVMPDEKLTHQPQATMATLLRLNLDAFGGELRARGTRAGCLAT
jgi:hypothetical protein